MSFPSRQVLSLTELRARRVPPSSRAAMSAHTSDPTAMRPPGRRLLGVSAGGFEMRSGGAGWCVAVQDASAIWAGSGCCAVGIEDQGPAPAMDDYQVVERAQQAAGGHRRVAIFGSGPQVMHVTADGRLVAA